MSETIETVAAPVAAPPAPDPVTEANRAIDEAPGENDGEPKPDEAKPADDAKPDEKPKAEKTPEQRALERAERKIDRLVRQREELRAQLNQGLPNAQIQGTNQPESDDSEPLTLSRAELQALIDKRAKEIAPTISEQQAEIEHRRKVVGTLAKAWGQEKFDALASDLDEALGGLADRSGKPKPATDAIFEADEPKALIEYLADPDNADEADALARMSPIQVGRAIAKLEAKLAAKPETKPQPSKAPPPLEPVKGQGTLAKDPNAMTDAEFATWRRRQIAQRH